ncbi:hypothetical protein A0J61_07105 [Choanephora cucurbitarum]|uniref:Uncharacterized protein n=1 Tax=Choanephora cucurbitarum TaxID=101091 RepID=A0A1C7N702_9FUNG|nr:hypothetical protein A0J61_07105 [Choanephora cucurbitarum]
MATDEEIIKGLRQELCVPDFWIEKEWQQWSVQNFDYEATRQNPGITRSVAHNDLSKDLNTLIKALNKSGRKTQRLKQMKLSLKTAHANSVNSHFWRVRAVKSAKLSDARFIARISRAVAEVLILFQTENLATATLTKIAKDVEPQDFNKRKHEEMTDNEECDQEENEEADGYDEENDNNGDYVTKKKHEKEDDKKEEFIDSIQKNIVISNNDARHELFKWAFKLQHKNEEYTPSNDAIDEILLKRDSNLDYLNHLSISILQNWVDNDEVLSHILRISLSGIIDLAHSWTAQYCKNVFPDARWSEFEELKYPLYNLTEESSDIYNNVMKILKNEDAQLGLERQPEHEALVYLSEKRHEYSVSMNNIYYLNGNESELECMEDCYSILKIAFRGSKYKFKLGEQACIESKTVREENEKAYANNENFDSAQNIMGRRIDLLLSSYETNVSSCEWKAENVSPSVARSQESKNLRVNASILEALLRLPHENNDSNRNSFVLMYSDWIGRDGCINTIVKEGNVFIVKKLGDVFIPKSVHEIDEEFKLTIKLLYTWKKNMDALVGLVLQGINKKRRDLKKAKMSVVNNNNEEPRFIFFTPKNNRTRPSELRERNPSED